MDDQLIKQKCGEFRVLIIGRSNAGKTTVLKRVCDTEEEPEIYNALGEKIDSSVLLPSATRGEHDINNEMVFRDQPGFRFHDSRGFESGGRTELDMVKTFITSRSQARKLKDQLHAIWYCIPVDNPRPFTAAETLFFSECGTGTVPVIALFTKFDALDKTAFRILCKEDLSREAARSQTSMRAKAIFEETTTLLNDIYALPHPPKGHVYLRDMHKQKADCGELMARTTGALDSEFLQQLLVSTQWNNLELCTQYALER